MRAARRARGFTLIELMVGSVVAVITLGAIAASFTAAQGAYQAEIRIKSSVEGARSSLAYLERVISMAGYGVDPRYAFNFTNPTGGIKNNDILVAYQASPVRAEITTDDLAFRYRDISFLRFGALSSGTLTLSVGNTFPVALRSGQLLQISCQGAASYAAVRTTAAAAAGTGSVTVDTAALVYVSKDGALPNTLPPCLTAPSPPVFITLIHEERVRIRMIGTPARPFLVVYHDWTGNVASGTPNYDPIAPDVEAFQVAYMMNRPTGSLPTMPTPPDDATNGNWIMGDATTDALPTDVPNATTAPFYDTSYTDLNRFNGRSANIRAVRVTLMVRSPGEDPRRRRAFPTETIEDWTPGGVGVTDGFYRTRATSMIRVSNMASRGFFNPPLIEAAMLPCPQTNCVDLNLGGG